MKRGFPMDSQPTFSGWKPSTSFAGLIELIIFCELICSGSGIWTRIPWNFEFALRSSMIDNSFCSVTSASKRIVSDTNPKDFNFLDFVLTYIWEAGSSPTNTTHRPGTTPLVDNTFIRSLNDSYTVAAVSKPESTLEDVMKSFVKQNRQ